MTQAGYYPCRIVWFRESPLADNHGTAGFELYTITSAGQKILVNDTNTPGSVLAFQSSTAPVAPYVQYAGPTAFVSSYRGHDFGLPRVQVQIHDGTSVAVDPASVKLSIDGALAWIYHDCVEQRSGESVRRLDITQPNENATRRFFCDRL